MPAAPPTHTPPPGATYRSRPASPGDTSGRRQEIYRVDGSFQESCPDHSLTAHPPPTHDPTRGPRQATDKPTRHTNTDPRTPPNHPQAGTATPAVHTPRAPPRTTPRPGPSPRRFTLPAPHPGPPPGRGRCPGGSHALRATATPVRDRPAPRPTVHHGPPDALRAPLTGQRQPQRPAATVRTPTPVRGSARCLRTADRPATAPPHAPLAPRTARPAAPVPGVGRPRPGGDPATADPRPRPAPRRYTGPADRRPGRETAAKHPAAESTRRTGRPGLRPEQYRSRPTRPPRQQASRKTPTAEITPPAMSEHVRTPPASNTTATFPQHPPYRSDFKGHQPMWRPGGAGAASWFCRRLPSSVVGCWTVFGWHRGCDEVADSRRSDAVIGGRVLLPDLRHGTQDTEAAFPTAITRTRTGNLPNPTPPTHTAAPPPAEGPPDLKAA
jgi:hypothetical protein